MVRLFALLPLVALLAACPPAPVPPPHPDASDASAFGDAPLPPTACGRACAAMQTAGCIVLTDCPTTLAASTAGHLLRNAKTGDWLTCDDIAAAHSAADIKALGQSCGP